MVFLSSMWRPLGLEGQKGRISDFKASKKQTGMCTKASRMLRGGGSGRVCPWQRLVWDPYDKSECCGGVFVRSRLLNGEGDCSYSRLFPCSQPSPTKKALESTKVWRLKNPKRENSLCDCGPESQIQLS
jgi:hypothetical protein